jgi:hypothetical protein
MPTSPIEELLYQALETERGSIRMYRAALGCVAEASLHAEWKERLAQAESHELILLGLCLDLGLDAEKDTVDRQIVRHRGLALMAAMELALTGQPGLEPLPPAFVPAADADYGPPPEPEPVPLDGELVGEELALTL